MAIGWPFYALAKSCRVTGWFSKGQIAKFVKALEEVSALPTSVLYLLANLVPAV